MSIATARWPILEAPVVHLQHDGHVPIRVAQGAGQTAHYWQAGDEFSHVVLAIKLPLQALEVGRVVGQAGRRDLQVKLQVKLAHAGIGLPVAKHGQGDGLRQTSLAGQLADDYLFLWRDEHSQVALH